MSLSKRFLLKFFRLYASRSYTRLERSLKKPQRSQMNTLQEILSHANSPIQTYADFRCLPLVTYDDLEAEILSAKNNDGPYLSGEKPFNYEPTSGSSGVKKLIPYTRPLIQSFTQMFLCWAYDLLQYGPKLKGGRLYFSVSPHFYEQETGLEDDSDYLSGLTGLAFQYFALLPPQIKKLKNPDDFFQVLCLYLLAANDLEVISVWSPSFLLSLLDYLNSHALELSELGAIGTITCQGICFNFGSIDPRKIEILANANFSNKFSLSTSVLFPDLKIISCWGAHNASAGFHQLESLFPNILVQEKGLLATEAPITNRKVNTG